MLAAAGQRSLARKARNKRHYEKKKGEKVAALQKQTMLESSNAHLQKMVEDLWQQQLLRQQQLHIAQEARQQSERRLQEQEEAYQRWLEESKQKAQIQTESQRVATLIMENLRVLVRDLPPTSPLRRPLLCQLTKGMLIEEMKSYLSMSDATARRVQKEQHVPREQSILWMRYQPGVRRKRKMQERQGLRECLDDLAPMPSTRSYRICTTTKRKFYEQYAGMMRHRKGHVFSRRFLLGKFLRRRHFKRPWQLQQQLRRARLNVMLGERGRVIRNGKIVVKQLDSEEKEKMKQEVEKVWDQIDVVEEEGRGLIRKEGERIQWVKDASSCKHCRRLAELQLKVNLDVLDEKEKVEYEQKRLHKALEHTQRAKYLVVKVKLEDGKYPAGTVLITQDFTQLVTTKGGFSQDLIVVWYHYDKGKGDLIRHTRHFVAGEREKRKRDKADVRFVVAVWEQLLETDWAEVKEVIAFSDGCGRQFKLTRFSLYLMRLSNRRPGLAIDYNFFASCHGYGVCDVVGAQGQRTIINFELDTKAAIVTPPELVAVLQRTRNHDAAVAPLPIEPVEGTVTSREGIKSWHRVLYCGGKMIAWRASTDEENGIPPIGRFEEGSTQKSLIFTAESKCERKKQRNSVPDPLPMVPNTAWLAKELARLSKKRKRRNTAF